MIEGESLLNYGWYVDNNDDNHPAIHIDMIPEKEYIARALSLPTPASKPPLYVLEGSLEAQNLWYATAGVRPQQPPEERQYFEKLWKENFDKSKAISSSSLLDLPEDNTNTSTIPNEFNEVVLLRGRGPFSNAVSKSYMNHRLSCVTLQVFRKIL
jgi:hypothetical protein